MESQSQDLVSLTELEVLVEKLDATKNGTVDYTLFVAALIPVDAAKGKDFSQSVLVLVHTQLFQVAALWSMLRHAKQAGRHGVLCRRLTMPRSRCPDAGTVLQTGMAVDAMPPRKLTLGQQLRGYPIYPPTWTQRGFASESGPNPSAPSSSSSQSTSSTSIISIYTQKGKKAVSKALHKTAETLRWLARRFAVLCGAFARNPLIIVEWYEDRGPHADIRDAINHFLKWVYTGFKLFGADVRTSFYLTKREQREQQEANISFNPFLLLPRGALRGTRTSILLAAISEHAAINFLRPFVRNEQMSRLVHPESCMTVQEQKYDNATLARKLKAKQEMADFWQQVVAQRTQELYESDEYADKAEELQAFQEKLSEGKEFPTLKEILRFASVFKSEMHLENMSTQQLHALSQMLGLPTSRTFWQGHVEVQLRHHITNLRREDSDLFWEGIDGLKAQELIDVCRRRAIRFHGVTEDEMRDSLNRWLRLSATHRQIPTSMLLWIQSFYLRDTTDPETDSTEDLKLKIEEKEIIEKPEDAFLSWAERQKDRPLKLPLSGSLASRVRWCCAS
eukprot:s4134_g5.t3